MVGVFRSNCENFESLKDDRNREDFFSSFDFSQTLSHLFLRCSPNSSVKLALVFFFFVFFSKILQKTRGTCRIFFDL